MSENNLSSNVQYLRDVHGRQIAGAIVDGWLRKLVHGSRHMLKSPRAWAIDAHALTVARTLGAVGVRVEDQETGKTYLADWAALDAHGYRFNRGFGDQVALQLTYWQLQGEPIQAALFA